MSNENIKSLGDDNKSEDEAPSEFTLVAIQKKNAENKKRLEEERAKANKGVIRSYRLKH